MLHAFFFYSQACTHAHLIPRVPNEALPVAGNCDELVSVVRDEVAPQQLALGVDLQLVSYRFVARVGREKRVTSFEGVLVYSQQGENLELSSRGTFSLSGARKEGKKVKQSLTRKHPNATYGSGFGVGQFTRQARQRTRRPIRWACEKTKEGTSTPGSCRRPGGSLPPVCGGLFVTLTPPSSLNHTYLYPLGLV